MILKATCSICRRPINLIVDDDYAKLRDPFGLTKRAICNRCGDFRDESFPVEERIKKLCMHLLSGAIGKSQMDKTKEALTALCQKYMRLVAEYKNTPIPMWDAEIVDSLIRTPGNFSLILKDLRIMCAQPSLV